MPPSDARIFVDTSAFFALADRSDRYHDAASAIFLDRAGLDELLTTDHVLVETWLLVRARLGRPAAMRSWDAFATGAVTLIGVQSEDLVRAQRIAYEWSDQTFSLVDCTSFAVIERLGLETALAFDRRFATFRSGPGRSRPLRILPGTLSP